MLEINLPNFLIVGAQKCGTTSLYDILNEHPEANISSVKDINFFSLENKFTLGVEYYSSYFNKPLKKHKITGEASPGYMNYPRVAEKIYHNLGEVKIVMILRDPIKRAYSQYWDNRRHLKEYLSEDEIIRDYLSTEYDSASKGYFSRGVYIQYIEEYLKYFSRDKMHIMIFEDLLKNPKKELSELYDFLGIDNSEQFLKLPKPSNSSTIWLNPIYNFLLKNPGYTKRIPIHARRLFFFGKKRAYKYELPSQKTMKILQDFYRPWNEKLEDFLGYKLTGWNHFNSKTEK